MSQIDQASAFLEQLTWDQYQVERERIIGLKRELFLENGSDIRRLLEVIRTMP